MKKTVVISGGGTGGHIYPGIAIAEVFLKAHPDYSVHFVGARGGLEEQIVPKAGYPLHLLTVGRLHHSVGRWRRLLGLMTLPLAFLQSFILFLKLRPTWVLGVGGFASGPFVFVSSILGARTALLEPNAVPGMANRYLARLVRVCFVVFSKTGEYFPSSKVHCVGLPVRIPKTKAKPREIGSTPLRVLIFGGSQGAKAINEVVGDWIEHLGSREGDFQIIHQVGGRHIAYWNHRYGKAYQSFLTYLPYIDDMPDKLAWADLVICRAGIGTVAEVAMSGKPAIFIPLPTAADNHQVKNAQMLVDQNAGLMIEERDLSWQKLDQQVSDFKRNPETLVSLMKNLDQIDYSKAPYEMIEVLMKGVK